MRPGLRVFSIIFVAFLLISCDEKPKTPVSEYGDALIDSYKKGQQAGEIATLDAVKKAVAAYHASNDRYPESLDEVKDLISSDLDLSKYEYNPKNGSVSLKKDNQ